MRGEVSTLHCDANDGSCSNWSVDYYEETASSVGSVRITMTERAPGWFSTDLTDTCPDHAREFGLNQ